MCVVSLEFLLNDDTTYLDRVYFGTQQKILNICKITVQIHPCLPFKKSTETTQTNEQKKLTRKNTINGTR